MSNHTPIQLPLAIEGLTVEIPLTRGFVAVVDVVDSDLALFNWRTGGNQSDRHYAVRWQYFEGNRCLLSMHRVILERILGRVLLKDEECDHRDLNTLNNCRSNLRIATRAQQGANRGLGKGNTSGFKGVYLNKRNGRWIAHIKVMGKHKMLGAYATPEEAHAAYCDAAVKYFGEFARFE